MFFRNDTEKFTKIFVPNMTTSTDRSIEWWGKRDFVTDHPPWCSLFAFRPHDDLMVIGCLVYYDDDDVYDVCVLYDSAVHAAIYKYGFGLYIACSQFPFLSGLFRFLSGKFCLDCDWDIRSVDLPLHK